ncbi:PP-loop family-domain-containing protein [Clohesyomyces aquaticus]|uniref:tRNA(Ile)-lysidine synthetase n=1 Tax=Clohesyomyces aquaticus TaxID=1231657 RepID=A0A1Y1ZTB4_9PLEO|nr:PP-loop family-domain-containing protein [Clohesyomyces aquaticus]
MALATLYARALQSDKKLPECHGIIIDHKFRPESSEEAAWVAEQLRSNFGMLSSIVELKWPEDLDMNDIKRFETEARRLRYKALGRACRDRRIESLLVAHHGDDLAETILMRLNRWRLRSGLQGMRAVTPIPECFGIYGVHHSGGRNSMSYENLPFPIESGGVEVLRPLLRFEKKRLVATCEEYGTKWAEDKTNQDKTLTSRNAIRHIMQHHTLPQALQAQSLISLAKTMTLRIKTHAEVAERLFNELRLRVDIQTGSLIVRFPPAEALLDRPIVTESDRIEARNTAALLLRRVADIVSPRDQLTIGQFASAIDKIWSSLATDAPHELDTMETSFCVYGIWWEPWEGPSIFSPDRGAPVFEPHEWRLTRQPLEAYELRDHILEIPSSLQQLLKDPTWHLFDGRWWIRILHPLRQSDITIRHFTDEDLKQLHKRPRSANNAARHSFDHAYIRTALGLLKPYTLRRTLPAIFIKDGSAKDVLVGLPTLGCAIRDGKLIPVLKPTALPWEVRYKKADLGTRRVEDTVVRGVKDADVMGAMRVAAMTGLRTSKVKKRVRFGE